MKLINRKVYYLIAIALLAGTLVTLSSCNNSAPTEPAGGTPRPSGGGGSTSLGTISYTPDYSRKQSAKLDTTVVNISATDASGIKWELSIPRQSFADSTIISIIPIKDVRSDTVYNITNGVMFEPDGFQFSSPATLTVTLPASSKTHLFYLFNQNGKRLDFAPVSETGGVYKISITHFSGAATGTPRNIKDYCDIATSKYQVALDEENALLSQSINPPVPPDIDIECGMDAAKEQALNNYIKDFMQPEDTVIKGMLGALAGMQMANCNQSTTAGGLAQVAPLAERLVKKAEMLYDQYSNNNKKFPAVAKAMLSADASLQLLGGTPPVDDLSKLGNWATKYFNDELTNLKQNHDYKVIKLLLTLAGQAQLFGNNSNLFLSQIENALTFKFYINEDLKAVLSDNTLADHIVFGGAFDVQLSFTANGLTGTGDIDYISGYLIDGCLDSKGNPQGGHDEINLPQSFSLTVRIDSVDLCKTDAIKMKFSQLGAFNEDWTYGVGISGVVTSSCARYVVPNHQFTLTDNYGVFGGTQYLDSNTGKYSFPVTIQNGNAVAVDKTYNLSQPYSDGVYSANLVIKLVHTPQ